MINENIHYISIKEVLSRLLEHPLLSDLNLEQVIRYTLDFITIFGFNKFYERKETELNIEEFRVLLPCDLVRINQIKDCKTNRCLRAMTREFNPTDETTEPMYKVQGRVLYTTIKNGTVTISYMSIPVDENGYPKLIDNPLYLKTLELYIKKEVFTVLFDLGKINQNVLTNTQQQYSWSAGQLQSEFTIPSIAEMESIKNMWTSMIQYNNYHLRDYNGMGNIEQLKSN